MSTTLQERMVELMTATGWTVGEIARTAGVTSAAVSQWVGNGSGKQSKTIGSMTAALKLEKASGFNWLWLAQGKGPKLVAIETQQEKGLPEADELSLALAVITKALQKTDKNTRIAVAPLFASMANEPEDAGNKSRLILRLLISDTVQPHRADNELPGHTSGELGRLTLGDEEHGRRDSTEAAGGRKR